jgi:integrase
MADALDSKSSARKGVRVRSPPPVLLIWQGLTSLRPTVRPSKWMAFYARFYARQREVGFIMRKKPKKPYASYPLYAHAGGVWAKKILGKVYYFGPWDDPQGALEKYLSQRDFLRGGIEPPEQQYTVGELLEAFLAEKQSHLDTGDIAQLTYNEYKTVCDIVRSHFGKHRPLDSLTQTDFAGLLARRKSGSTPLAVASLKRRLTIARMIFTDQRSLCRKALKAPAQRLLRERTRARGKLLYSAAEIRALVKAADSHMQAMILLGISCAFGPRDCCTLPTEAIDFLGGWHDYARPKTGVERRAALWPETLAALKQVADEKHAFNGRKWTRHIVAREFIKVCEAADVRNLGFYSLRRTFETIVTTASVPQAIVDHIMGHANNDMASVYRQQVFDQQLRDCSEHVRAWYLGKLTLA